MKKILPVCIILLSVLACSPTNLEKPPKLVIGIVVDQMRYDYITRYWDDLSPNGFKRFYNEGFVAHNHHFNYYQTLTGPGHASISTGTTPSVHGIIGNEWYDRTTQKRYTVLMTIMWKDWGLLQKEKISETPHYNHFCRSTSPAYTVS